MSGRRRTRKDRTKARRVETETGKTGVGGEGGYKWKLGVVESWKYVVNDGQCKSCNE